MTPADPQAPPEDGGGVDLRMPVLGAATWLVVLAVLAGPRWLAPALVAVAAGLVWRRRRHPVAGTLVAVLLATTGTGVVAGLRAEQVTGGPVRELAVREASISAILQVGSDPKVVRGRFGDRILLRGSLREVSGRGRTWRVRAPVVVLADPSWDRVPLGATVRLHGRVVVAEGDATALVLARDGPESVAGPGWWWGAAEAVRSSLRESVRHRPADQRALVPALVVGDDSRVSEDLASTFQVTGLTHLLAVSGTNLTLLVGFLLVLARWAGVRGRWLLLVGAGGIVGFVLLARTEPSVVRAAAMGTVALLGLGRNGLRRGTRGLGIAVFVLLLVDPWLALSAGFGLSVLATAGILFLAPPWRDALGRWVPRWMAEAVAVPAAAQLACTPLVAAISGQVSLVAVATNLLAAPAVGPATVLGLAAGLLGLVWTPLGQVVGTLAGWCVGWIVLVADLGAGLPTAAITWGTGPVALLVLTLGCVVLALVAPPLLRHPVTGIGCALVSIALVLVRPPTPGWPPDGWTVAACDVGQGDALALRAGPDSAVVVDAGPDPALVDACLRRLEVEHVPLLVLTHFHADHVDGLPGVLAGRDVDAIEVTALADPAEGAAQVTRAAGALVPSVPAYGEVRRFGAVSLQVIGPPARFAAGADSGEESAANNASVVLLAQVRGVRILLTGDVEPAAQRALRDTLAGVQVDVLKVPHHGSRHQDLDLLLGVRPRVALVSVGADNDYGHPSADTMAPLTAAGVLVGRTDLDGDVLVGSRDGQVWMRTAR